MPWYPSLSSTTTPSSKLFQTRDCASMPADSLLHRQKEGDERRRGEEKEEGKKTLHDFSLKELQQLLPRPSPSSFLENALVSSTCSFASRRSPVSVEDKTRKKKPQTRPAPRVQSRSRNGSCINARSQTRMIIPSWLPAANREHPLPPLWSPRARAL